MGYFSEFRLNWPNLLGAGLGLAFGTAFNHYMLNLFVPALMGEFGWTKSELSLVNSLGLPGIVFTPIAGRMADCWGRASQHDRFFDPDSLCRAQPDGRQHHHLYIMLFISCSAS